MSYLGTTGQVTGVNSTSGPSLQYAYGSNLQDRRLAQIKNLGSAGQVHSQFDFTTNPVGEITQIIETHGGGSGTPTPTPTNTTTPTPTPTPTVTPPCDDDDDHHHGNHHGNGHHEHGNGNGNGHHNGGNHGNHHNGNNGHHGGKDKHGSLFFLPDSDDMQTGTTALVLTLCGLLLASTLRQPAGRRALVVRLTSLGLAGTLALQGCLVGNIDAGPNTSITMSYDYDNLSQLVGVNINQTPAASFQFDPAGNLLSLTVGNTTTAQTFNALNQKTTPGTNLYDAKGQTTDKDGRTFEWDDDGRMTAIVDGTHRSEMAYDGLGRRIKIAEFDNGTLTSKKLYWWLGGEIVCERDGIDPGFPITKRYFGQGVVVGAERLYYTMDQLGSVRELVDANGVVRADYRYTPYGERTKVGGDLDSDFGFAGLFHHGPSGLDLATYRTYDSKMGRWISRDPLGEGVDYNLYRYCGNNPISCVDPEGLRDQTYDMAHQTGVFNPGFDMQMAGQGITASGLVGGGLIAGSLHFLFFGTAPYVAEGVAGPAISAEMAETAISRTIFGEIMKRLGIVVAVDITVETACGQVINTTTIYLYRRGLFSAGQAIITGAHELTHILIYRGAALVGLHRFLRHPAVDHIDEAAAGFVERLAYLMYGG